MFDPSCRIELCAEGTGGTSLAARHESKGAEPEMLVGRGYDRRWVAAVSHAPKQN
jgi:hypothetical protein